MPERGGETRRRGIRDPIGPEESAGVAPPPKSTTKDSRIQSFRKDETGERHDGAVGNLRRNAPYYPGYKPP